MVFAIETFLIHMYHLPLACLNVIMGEQIGKTIGRVSDCVVWYYGASEGRNFWVCVEVNLYKPIPRGRTINVKGDCLWIPFTFERLPGLCFKCWQILYGDGRCMQQESVNTKQYGTWLCASFPRSRSSFQWASRAQKWNLKLISTNRTSRTVVVHQRSRVVTQLGDKVKRIQKLYEHLYLHEIRSKTTGHGRRYGYVRH